MSPDRLLDADDVEHLLRDLAERLRERGVDGWLYVVGGAAMALAYGRDRLTRDVDGVFEPSAVVREAAVEVAERHDLEPDWLTDAVKGFVLGSDPDATTHLDVPGLRVVVASPQHLFVMKAMAARVERDAADLVRLYDLCGFASVDEALATVERAVPPRLLHPKTAFLLRELLDDPGN